MKGIITRLCMSANLHYCAGNSDLATGHSFSNPPKEAAHPLQLQTYYALGRGLTPNSKRTPSGIISTPARRCNQRISHLFFPPCAARHGTPRTCARARLTVSMPRLPRTRKASAIISPPRAATTSNKQSGQVPRGSRAAPFPFGISISLPPSLAPCGASRSFNSSPHQRL